MTFGNCHPCDAKPDCNIAPAPLNVLLSFSVVTSSADAILIDESYDNAEDEAGDVLFVLTQIVELIGTNLNKAHKRAVKKVLARKVVVVDGKAIKESDL